ncbi:MAG TPA: TolC family protein [Bryobacteraceae bacterium]|nr:TolC family protein [Bryobacteraceae bacterium]
MFPLFRFAAAALLAAGLHAQVRTMTLREAVDQALKQNPDVVMAAFDEEKARQSVRQAKDPFTPRIVIGSGLAYTNGFPMSIEGSAPSIMQAQATQFLFNRPQSYAVAQAKENARGAGLAVAGRRDEVAFRTASLYLDAERAGRLVELARKEVESLERVAGMVDSQVEEGRVLPIERRRAALNLAQARQMLESLESDRLTAETSLGILLGLGPDESVRPAGERPSPPLPSSEDAAVESAVEANKSLRHIESRIMAQGLQLRAERAARLPRVDLVAQYGLFSRFNNYEEYFRRFQRHNGQIGVSFQLPLLPGPGVGAATAQVQAETGRLRAELNATRNRVIADTRQSFRDVRRTESAREVARLDLELAREQLSILLAQMQEGRASLVQVEQARVDEASRWIQFYDAQYAVERARYNLLRNTGDLQAALR